MYLDAHAHTINQNREIKTIISLDPRIEQLPDLNQSFFTLGLHPWYIAEVSLDKVLTKIVNLKDHPHFFGLGECGLDRHKEDDFELQLKVFDAQLSFAHENKIKLVVIHCVRAFSDLLAVLKQTRYRNKLFFHDYNGNLETTNELLRYDSYFSFGYKLKNETTKAYKSFTALPLSRIFLETDDFDIKIEKVYDIASEIKKISLDDLKNQMQKNLGVIQNKTT
jgi:TatD DNase family protein